MGAGCLTLLIGLVALGGVLLTGWLGFAVLAAIFGAIGGARSDSGNASRDADELLRKAEAWTEKKERKRVREKLKREAQRANLPKFPL